VTVLSFLFGSGHGIILEAIFQRSFYLNFHPVRCFLARSHVLLSLSSDYCLFNLVPLWLELPYILHAFLEMLDAWMI
jgi:hypothetical protein